MGVMTGYYPDEPDLEEIEWERLNLPSLPYSRVSPTEIKSVLDRLGVSDAPDWIERFALLLCRGRITDDDAIAYAIAARMTEPLYELGDGE